MNAAEQHIQSLAKSDIRRSRISMQLENYSCQTQNQSTNTEGPPGRRKEKNRDKNSGGFFALVRQETKKTDGSRRIAE